MRLRHAVVTASAPGTATVTLDGASVTVPASAGASLAVGDTATLLQDGRRIVALSAPVQNAVTFVGYATGTSGFARTGRTLTSGRRR